MHIIDTFFLLINSLHFSSKDEINIIFNQCKYVTISYNTLVYNLLRKRQSSLQHTAPRDIVKEKLGQLWACGSYKNMPDPQLRGVQNGFGFETV